MNVAGNFYLRNVSEVLISVFLIFLFTVAFSSVSTSSFDESMVEGMVEQKCSNSYTQNVPLDSNIGFDNVIKFNGSYIPLSQVDCEYIDRYKYNVGAYWNLDDLRQAIGTTVLSIPVIYSLVLATPILGLYNTRNTKHHLKRYFRFAQVNILVPTISVTIFYIGEVLLRLIFSGYLKIPYLIFLLFLIGPVSFINKGKIETHQLSEKEVKFMAGMLTAAILFWIVRSL